MTTTTHVDKSEVVMDHFARTNQVLAEVLGWPPEQVEELLDSVPSSKEGLVEALKGVLRWQGQCVPEADGKAMGC